MLNHFRTVKLQLSLFLILLSLSCSYFVSAEENTEKQVHEYAIDIFKTTESRAAARQWMGKSGKTDVVPVLIRSLRYFPEDRHETLPLLKQLTGQELGKEWFDWMVWLENYPTDEFKNNESYLLYFTTRIDKQFEVFFYPGMERSIRLGEIVWGGVRKDGIPALNNPKLIEANEAEYITDKELVFGISINGDTRAYPYRFMDWHEMFNDTIGGVPVSLAYCTLCGSGILYKTQIKEDEEALIFGSSGWRVEKTIPGYQSALRRYRLSS